MAEKKTLADRVHEKYNDPELEKAILEDIAEHKTERGIMEGIYNLPHPDDARRWLAARKKRNEQASVEAKQGEVITAQKSRIDVLQEQLDALKAAQPGGQK